MACEASHDTIPKMAAGETSAFQTRPVTISGRRGLEVSTQGITVMVQDGPDQGAEASLTGPVLTVGTDRTCDLALSDPTVSRQHALLKLVREGIVAEDLESTNGTWLSGVRIRSVFVPDGSLLQVGDTVLRVTLAPRRFVAFPESETALCDLIGASRPMREMFAVIRQIARTDLPVLLVGETGTGKELVARAIHQSSPRAAKPLMVLDCGSVIPDLLRSELFGHEKGAFTGADRTAKGILEEADGGTVFLDEIGELPLSLQPNLLRALENREITRVGGRQLQRVDFRIVAATNKDLGSMCQQGRFREDLYFRLAGVAITPPPLRERLEDIPVLVGRFLANFSRRNNLAALTLSDRAHRALGTYEWPGNVRELRQVSELLAANARGRVIEREDVEEVLQSVRLRRQAGPEPAGTLDDAERAAIERALKASGGNKQEAARSLKMSRSTLYVKILKYRIGEPPDAAS
jgi:DNA-binding NtrC family response regulator